MKELTKGVLELYLHIPFCVKKCLYCDFLSGPADRTVMAAYVEALKAELEGRAEGCADFKVTSVFLGGGTPSLLEGERILELLETIKKYYCLDPCAEITIEANPGTVNRQKLACWRRAGINRLSIGLQSAFDEELAVLGRIHTWQQFLQTYEDALSEGFDNINIDLMSALPGQTPESWRASLEKVLSLKPPPCHISAYSLILEEGTQLYRLWEEGKLELLDEDADRLMYWETGRILEQAGYGRYEISNYALAGRECRHNCGYWSRRDYLGFGIGAASLFQNVRFQNSRSLQAYLEHPLNCRQEEHALSLGEQMEEFMFLGLRKTEGISPQGFQEYFGQPLEEIYGQVIKKNLTDGLLEYRENGEGEMLALTDRGLDLSNYVFAQFLLDEDPA